MVHGGAIGDLSLEENVFSNYYATKWVVHKLWTR